jgi:magnesium-transporting ATPase (P-type)
MPLFNRKSGTSLQGEHELVKDRLGWVLSLLYASDKDGTREPVKGWTELRLMLFLVHYKLENTLYKESPFEFSADAIGPVDQELVETVSQGVDEEMIERANKEREDEELYCLTSTGERRARELYDSLSDEERRLLEWVKYSPSHDSPTNLLASVYRKHSDMFDSDFSL